MILVLMNSTVGLVLFAPIVMDSFDEVHRVELCTDDTGFLHDRVDGDDALELLRTHFHVLCFWNF